MATKLVMQIFQEMENAKEPVIARFDTPDTRIPWPGQSRNVWPQADISGHLVTDEVFIVEVDDHADPGRSLVKYWPLLAAMENGRFQFPPIVFIEVSKPDSTFGYGYQELACFIAQRFVEEYGRRFRFKFIDLTGSNPATIAKNVLQFFKQGLKAPV